MTEAADWIRKLRMQAHPEGGYYVRVYASPVNAGPSLLGPEFSGPRPLTTHIYYLLESGTFSAFHRIRSDELWHFYAGSGLTLYEIKPDGSLYTHELGNQSGSEAVPYCVIPASSWFAARPATGDGYALVGCTVTPGFDFAEFEMAEREQLCREYPLHRDLIVSLTR